jgi:hypothetical protein
MNRESCSLFKQARSHSAQSQNGVDAFLHVAFT